MKIFRYLWPWGCPAAELHRRGPVEETKHVKKAVLDAREVARGIGTRALDTIERQVTAERQSIIEDTENALRALLATTLDRTRP